MRLRSPLPSPSQWPSLESKRLKFPDESYLNVDAAIQGCQLLSLNREEFSYHTIFPLWILNRELMTKNPFSFATSMEPQRSSYVINKSWWPFFFFFNSSIPIATNQYPKWQFFVHLVFNINKRKINFWISLPSHLSDVGDFLFSTDQVWNFLTFFWFPDCGYHVNENVGRRRV